MEGNDAVDQRIMELFHGLSREEKEKYYVIFSRAQGEPGRPSSLQGQHQAIKP